MAKEKDDFILDTDDSLDIIQGLVWNKLVPGSVTRAGSVDFQFAEGFDTEPDWPRITKFLKSVGVPLDSYGVPKDIPNTPSGRKKVLEVLTKIRSKDPKLFESIKNAGVTSAFRVSAEASRVQGARTRAKVSVADRAKARLQRRFVSAAARAMRQGPFAKLDREFWQSKESQKVYELDGKKVPAAVRIRGFGGPLDAIVEGILSEYSEGRGVTELGKAFSVLGFGSGGKRTGLAAQIGNIFEKDPELAISVLMASIVYPGTKGSLKINPKTGQITFSGNVADRNVIKSTASDFQKIAEILATGKLAGEKVSLTGSSSDKIVQAFLAYASKNPGAMQDQETRLKLALKAVKDGKYQSGDVSKAPPPTGNKGYFVDTTKDGPELYRWDAKAKSWVFVNASAIQIKRVISGDQILVDPKAAEQLKRYFRAAEMAISGSSQARDVVKILKELHRSRETIETQAEIKLGQEKMAEARRGERRAVRSAKIEKTKELESQLKNLLEAMHDEISQTKYGSRIPKGGLTKAFIVSTISAITEERKKLAIRLGKDLQGTTRKGRKDDERAYVAALDSEYALVEMYQHLRGMPPSIRRLVPGLVDKKGGKGLAARLPKLGMGKAKIILRPSEIFRGKSPQERQEEYRQKVKDTVKALDPEISSSRKILQELATSYGARKTTGYAGALSETEAAILKFAQIQAEVRDKSDLPLQGRHMPIFRSSVFSDDTTMSNIRAGIANHIASKNAEIANLHLSGKLFDSLGRITPEGRLAVEELLGITQRYKEVMKVIGGGKVPYKDASGKLLYTSIDLKYLGKMERFEGVANRVFSAKGIITYDQLREMGLSPSSTNGTMQSVMRAQGKTNQQIQEDLIQAEAAAKMNPEKILKRLFAVSGEDAVGRAARMELFGFLRQQLGSRIDREAVDPRRIDSLLASLGIGKGGSLDFRSIGLKGEGTLQDIFKNIFPNESYSKKLIQSWFDDLTKEGVRQLKATPESATSKLVERPLTKEQVAEEMGRLRDQAKLARQEAKAASAKEKSSRATRASGKLSTAAGVNEQGVPVDEKGRPFVVGAKGDRFAAPGQGKPPTGISGLEKYLVKQGLISSADQLVMQPKVRGKKQGIDVEATAAAAKLGDAGKAMLSMVNAVRASGMRFDPSTGVPLAQTGAFDLYKAIHGGKQAGGPSLTPKQKEAIKSAIDDVMKSETIRSGKSGMTAAEWLASQMRRAKPPSEKVLRKGFLKKFGSEETLREIGKRAGIDLSPENMSSLRGQFEAAKAAAAQRKAFRANVRSQIKARADWQANAAARYATGKIPLERRIDFGDQSPLPNRAAGILPTRAPRKIVTPAFASKGAAKTVTEAAVGAVESVAGHAVGGRIPNIDLGPVGTMLDQIGKIRSPNIGNLQKIVIALQKVQEILDTASGIKGGIAGKMQGGAGRSIGARLYNAATKTGRPFRFVDSEQAQYQKAAADYDAARKKALSASVDQIKSGAILGKILPGIVRGGQRTTIGSELDRIQSEIFKGLESRAISRAQRAVRAGRPATGYASDAEGNLSLGPQMALQMQGRARAAAITRMAQMFPRQLASIQTEILREARSAFRATTAPIRSAAAQRAVTFDRGGSQRPPGYAVRTGGFGGGGGGGVGGPLRGAGGFGMGGFGGMVIPGPQIGTDGVTKFANDTMGILGNLKQQIQFGFSQEITREISQALGAVLAHFKDGIIKFNATLETSTVAFQTLFENEMKKQGETVDVGKATQEATYMVESIQRFANITPFRFPELVEAARKMRAFGFETKEILPNLQSIGDAVAALGGEDDKIRRITYALGQMRSAGRVYQNDMMQLANAGIAGYEILSRALLQDFVKTGDITLEYNGKTIDKAYVQTVEGQAALVTATTKVTDKATRNQVRLAKSSSSEIAAIFTRISEDPIEAIRDLTSGGKIGRGAADAIIDGLSQNYGGGMKKLSKTFEGGLSTLADVSQYFVARVTRPIFEATRDAVIDLGLFFQSTYAQRLVTQFADGFAKLIPPATKTLNDLTSIATNSANGVFNAFNGLFSSLNDGGEGMSAIERFGDGIAILADIMRTDLAQSIVGVIIAVKALSMAAGLNPMLLMISGIVVGISAINTMLGESKTNEMTSMFGSMIMAVNTMKSTIGPLLQRIATIASGAFGATFLTFLKVATPLLEKMLHVVELIMRAFTSMPGLSESLGLATSYVLLKKMVVPINQMILGTQSAIDPRSGQVVPGKLGIMGGLDNALRNLYNSIYMRGGAVARLAGIGPSSAEAGMLSARRFAAMEARGALPSGGAARASGAFRSVLAQAIQNRGLAGARDVLGYTARSARGGTTVGRSVALRAGLNAGNFSATADEILQRRVMSLREAIMALVGGPMGRIGDYYKRFRFGGLSSIVPQTRQLLLGPGNLQLGAGAINAQKLLPGPKIAGLLPAAAESLGLRLPDQSPIRGIAKLTMIERMIMAAERYAEAMVRLHKPLIYLAENIENIPSAIKRMSASVADMGSRLKASGLRIVDKAIDVYIKAMYKLFTWPWVVQDTIPKIKNLISGKFTSGFTAAFNKVITLSIGAFDSAYRGILSARSATMSKVFPGVGNWGEQGAMAPIGQRIRQAVARPFTSALDFAANRFTVRSPIQTSALGPVSTFGRFQTAVSAFASSVKTFAQAAKAGAVTAGSSLLGKITSLGLPALALAALTKGKSAGLTGIKGLGTLAITGGKTALNFGAGALKKIGTSGLVASGLTLASAAGRISSGEDTGRVAVESGFDLLGTLGGAAIGAGIAGMIGLTGGVGALLLPILGSVLASNVTAGIGTSVADSLGMPDVAAQQAEGGIVDSPEVQRAIALRDAFADTKLTVEEINGLLQNYDIRIDEIVGAMKGTGNTLPSTSEMLQSVSARLPIGKKEFADTLKVLNLITDEMTRQNQAVAKGAGDWTAYSNAGKAAMAELAIRLAQAPKFTSLEQLQEFVSVLAKEFGIKLDNLPYNLYNAGAAAEAAQKKVSKLQAAVDKLRSTIQKLSGRLSNRIMMLFDERLQKDLEKARDTLDSTFEVVYDGVTTNVKALRDEIEAQEKKNRLLEIEKRIREATRNVELARLAQYDASVDPLEAAARMREAEEAKTAAVREAALERKKIALDEALTSTPYKNAVTDLEQKFESVRLKFQEGMEDILAQLEAGKITGDEAIAKIQALYSESFAIVGDLDANLVQDAAEFGDNFVGTWDPIIDKLKKVVDKFIAQIKRLKRAIKSLNDPRDTGDVETDTTGFSNNSPDSLGGRPYDNWQGHGMTITNQVAQETASMTESTQKLALHAVRLRFMGLWKALQDKAAAGPIQKGISFAMTFGRIMSNALGRFAFGAPMRQIYVDSTKTGANAQSIEQRFAAGLLSLKSLTKILGKDDPIANFASGGTIMGPGMFTVGEAGRETLQVVPGGVARVFPRRIRPIHGIGAAGGSGGSVNASVIINNPTVRNDQDIRKLAEEVSRAQRSLLRSSGVGRI